eukprot:1951189-Amphidinium_carterae.1
MKSVGADIHWTLLTCRGSSVPDQIERYVWLHSAKASASAAAAGLQSLAVQDLHHSTLPTEAEPPRILGLERKLKRVAKANSV